MSRARGGREPSTAHAHETPPARRARCCGEPRSPLSPRTYARPERTFWLAPPTPSRYRPQETARRLEAAHSGAGRSGNDCGDEWGRARVAQMEPWAGWASVDVGRGLEAIGRPEDVHRREGWAERVLHRWGWQDGLSGVDRYFAES